MIDIYVIRPSDRESSASPNEASNTELAVLSIQTEKQSLKESIMYVVLVLCQILPQVITDSF